MWKDNREPEKVPLDTLLEQGVPVPQKYEKVIEKGIVIKSKFNPYHQHEDIIEDSTQEQEEKKEEKTDTQ